MRLRIDVRISEHWLRNIYNLYALNIKDKEIPNLFQDKNTPKFPFFIIFALLPDQTK